MADTESVLKFDRSALGQIVLVLQGGGALGAYQAGVYQALSEAGIEPDWVIGTSIGAINAAIIAGNPPEIRIGRLREFWTRVQHGPLTQLVSAASMFGQWAANTLALGSGVPGFFEPNPQAFLGVHVRLGPEFAGYYSTKPLERTLRDLIDPSLLNAGRPRLTVGAANVQTGEMHYFDSRETQLTIQHIIASGALPPAFPAVRIGDQLYWDGGVLSNTPVEAVFDDNPRRSGVVFTVHLWGPNGPEPDSIWRVLARQKDLQYSSRAASHVARQKQLHKLRRVIMELAAKLPQHVADLPATRELASYGCVTRMHVVRLMAPALTGEDHSKDIDFSPSGITYRWNAGNTDTTRVLRQAPWTHDFDPLEGLILHQAEAGEMRFEG
ncbi:MAG TPA: patatin-like phospholipase family protein [Pseudolabrys sp.]|nr:patatin-like phospholipase family protein [Pseudolabrys sp.]